MATDSNILAWNIPRMEEPGRIQSMGSQKGQNDWATNAFIIIRDLTKLTQIILVLVLKKNLI